MRPYVDEVKRILHQGWWKEPAREREQKIRTKELFGSFMQFDMQQGFPIVTVKHTWFKGIVHELIWFLQGSEDIDYLQAHKCRFWDKWADENGYVGPIYGAQWRNWNNKGIDQIRLLIEDLRKNPDSRRHVISSWNVEQISQMALPPCHFAAVFNVTAGKLSCSAHQRSGDFFIGVPFDISSYALFTHMLAHVCGYEVGILNYYIDSAHIYEPHIELCEKMVKLEPLPLPRLELNPEIKDIDDFRFEDLALIDYRHQGRMKAEVFA